MSIRVSHVSFTYRSRAQVALSDVSVEFKPGQIALVAGASGCGKTTLIRCINGLIPHSYANGILKGRITLFDQEVGLMPLSQTSQLVGTVLQDPEQQIVASDVMSEIAFGLENLGLPRDDIRVRVRETAQFLNITHLLDRETFALSGGEKQKVALAGVLAMRPRGLLLDEPLASLDPASGYETLLLLRALAKTGIAVVIVEHRIEDILAITPEHCVYMTDGRITYDGDAQGFVNSVDWREVKLPAKVIMQRVRAISTTRTAIAPISDQPPRKETPLVEFHDVSFRYKDGPLVLRGISFKVHQGDRIAILGPNGAGKSTLIKHAIGLHQPASGQVLIKGTDSHSLSVAQNARTVGYVFQSPSHMLFAPTVREELTFGPRNIGFDSASISQSISRALGAVRMPGFEETAPLALSFGQQKRICIASILTMNPAVLVLDEPSAGQDYASYTHFMDDIIGTGQAAYAFDAVMFITHDLDLAITYANRILLLAEGRILADGTPDNVLGNRDMLDACRLRSTSLLEVNQLYLSKTGRFLPAYQLAEFA